MSPSVIRRLVLLAAVTLAPPCAAQTPPPAAQPTPLTLAAALAQARMNSQAYRQADLAAQLATEDRKQARAALLPSLSEFSQFIYTQPNGTPSGVFVANDGPKIYNTWVTVHGDVFAPGKWAEYRVAAAAEASARAKADIASRTDPISAMPPLGLILKPHEVRDLVEFLAGMR